MVSLMFFAALVAMSYARAALLLGCCRFIMSVSIGLQYVVNQPSHILVAPGSVSLIMYRMHHLTPMGDPAGYLDGGKGIPWNTMECVSWVGTIPFSEQDVYLQSKNA